MCGLWPSWAGDDGAWAQGPSYSLAYVTIMTMFASALKRGTGVDLYRLEGGYVRWAAFRSGDGGEVEETTTRKQKRVGNSVRGRTIRPFVKTSWRMNE